MNEIATLMRKAIIYYVADAPEYQSLMDDLSKIATDQQWERLCRWLAEADLFLGESEIGTLAQREKFFAQQEGRPNRFPSIFESDEVYAQKIEQLIEEYQRKGIPFRLED